MVATPLTPVAVQRAAADFDALLSEDRTLAPDELVSVACHHRAAGLLVSPRITISESTIAALPPTVEAIATASVGYDHIDLSAASRRGVVVTHTPDVLTEATAEHTMMLILCACRRAAEYTAIMRSGWRRTYEFHEMLGVQLRGRTLGILGMGRIGRSVAAMARAFGMRVLYHNRRRLPAEIEQGAIYCPAFEVLLPHSQVLSLNAPANADTGHILNSARIALLPDAAIVVNTGRGALIDEDALIAALHVGKIAGAGLDVFNSEPNFDVRFLELPNVFLTPHMASATSETRDAMGLRALDNLAAVLSGNFAPDPVVPGSA